MTKTRWCHILARRVSKKNSTIYCLWGADFVVKKSTYDCFASSELIDYLEQRGITDLVICGVFTDGCVLPALLVALVRGTFYYSTRFSRNDRFAGAARATKFVVGLYFSDTIR